MFRERVSGASSFVCTGLKTWPSFVAASAFCYLQVVIKIKLKKPDGSTVQSLTIFIQINLLSMISLKFKVMCKIVYVIYQTRKTMFHQDIQRLRRELKIQCAAEYF